MSAAWIVYLLVAGTLLALSGRAVASMLSLGGRSTRWVWAATLAGILALGLVAPRARTLNDVTTTIAMAAPAARSFGSPTRPDLGALIEAARVSIESGVVRAIAIVSAGIPGSAAHAAAVVWMLASTLLLALYLVVNLRVARVRRRWPRERLHGVDVRLAPTAGPAVIGVLRAEIVVPRALLERSDEEQRLILAHEHEHLRARDNVLLALACIVVIVLPWHPAVWYVLAQLRLAIELDCDARVLRRGAAPRSYGALLIDMAAHGAGIRVGTLALADRPSHLERRLMAMRTHRTRFALVRGSALSAVAGLLVLAACEAKIPTAAEVNGMDVAGMKTAAERTGLLHDFSNADFILDGVSATREQALAISSERIGSIEVVKGARDTIIVTTKERMPQGDDTGVTHRRMNALGSAETQSKTMIRTQDGSRQPAVMIDGAVATEAMLAALDPQKIESVMVRKATGGAVDPLYPNGLIIVQTKKRAAEPAERRKSTLEGRGN
ncbi:MAG: putative rane protein [Gemmatimonadetes bacterium]|nr:putative rane protein [Gemmatimonadota bacterium]